MLQQKISLQINLSRFKSIGIHHIPEQKQSRHQNRLNSILISTFCQSSAHETYIVKSLEKQQIEKKPLFQKISQQLQVVHILQDSEDNMTPIIKTKFDKNKQLLSQHYDKVIFAQESLQFVQQYDQTSYLALERFNKHEHRIFINSLHEKLNFEFKSKLKIGTNNQISNLSLLKSKNSLFIHYHSDQNPELNEVKLFDLPSAILLDLKVQFFARHFRHNHLHMFPQTVSIFADLFVNGIYDIQQNATILGLYDLRSHSGHLCLLSDSHINYEGGFQYISKINSRPFQILTTKKQSYQKFKPILLDIRKPMSFIEMGNQQLSWKHLRYMKIDKQHVWIVCKKFDGFSYKCSQIKCYQLSK